MDDLIKNCIDGIVSQQNAQASMYDEGYKKGYADGITRARQEYEKNLIEAEQIMLEGMARDHEKEAKEFYADKTH